VKVRDLREVNMQPSVDEMKLIQKMHRDGCDLVQSFRLHGSGNIHKT